MEPSALRSAAAPLRAKLARLAAYMGQFYWIKPDTGRLRGIGRPDAGTHSAASWQNLLLTLALLSALTADHCTLRGSSRALGGRILSRRITFTQRGSHGTSWLVVLALARRPSDLRPPHES